MGRYPDRPLAEARSEAIRERGRHDAEAKNPDGTPEAAALADAEGFADRHAPDGATPRRDLHDALAGRRSHDGLVDHSGRVVEERRSTPGAVLNQRSVTHNTVTTIYDRYRYDKEKRAALEKWAEVLSGIVDVKPAPTTAPARRARGQNVYEFKPPATRRAQAGVH